MSDGIRTRDVWNHNPVERDSKAEKTTQNRAYSPSVGGNSPVSDPKILTDSNLQTIIDAWPALPEAIRLGIMAMVNASASPTTWKHVPEA